MDQRNLKLHRKNPHVDRDYELSRRQFMQLVAASAAVSLAEGCQPNPPEQIMPYVRRPPDVVPGKSSFYATSFAIDGYATGLLVETREGRPIKVEGNPAHPASLGGTSIFHQAAVLQLYDPDRAKTVVHRGLPAAWPALETELATLRNDRGAGLRLVLEPSSSPLLLDLVAQVKQLYPLTKVTFYTPVPSEPATSISPQLFGQVVAPQYVLSAADVIVALDSDFLVTPYQLTYQHDFSKRRHIAHPSQDLNRLYCVESALSLTGTMSDHRLCRQSSRVAAIAAAIAGELLAPNTLPPPRTALDPEEQRFVNALVRDVTSRAHGRTLFVPGERQPLVVHGLCHLMNEQLGNVGSTVTFTPSALADSHSDQDLAALVAEMHAGAVDRLIVIGSNPSYDAPPDLDWSRALARVPHSLYVGTYHNETAEECEWFAPLAHPFETWGDGRAYDGTLTIVQPLIRTMYQSKSASEVLAMLARQPLVGDYARLRVRFGQTMQEGLDVQLSAAERQQRANPDVQAAFEATLARGFVADSAFKPASVSVNRERVLSALASAAAPQPHDHQLEINFVRSPTLHDGRFANLSWLLELPEPITRLTWDNAALMSPRTAQRLGVPELSAEWDDEYPVIEITRAGRSLHVPVLRVDGHADDAVTLWLGYGREGEEKLARGAGVNAYRLRTRGAEHFANDLQVHTLSERYPLAITQRHHDMHDRPIALRTTLNEYRGDPDFTSEHKGPLPTLLSNYDQSGVQWAMSIDMGMCVGCSACVVACQAENNLLIVGKDQVRRGRAMHWLRIDVYSTREHPERLVHQPMLCQHCEKAPCEYVCPVNATEHSPDGLNEMVYNRCVGTRFCSNNCPYKVRRFNWFNWLNHETANQGSVSLQRNPEVSVRERGVMEKCTYCVQRIRAAEIEARIDQREIRPGEVVTACQQACPSKAITFGSLTHKDTPMVKWREQKRSYAVLHETGARPRTMYLARIDNPNPELA